MEISCSIFLRMEISWLTIKRCYFSVTDQIFFNVRSKFGP